MRTHNHLCSGGFAVNVKEETKAEEEIEYNNIQ